MLVNCSSRMPANAFYLEVFRLTEFVLFCWAVLGCFVLDRYDLC